MYPELVIDHRWAVYANGILDATGQPSKVSDEHFEQVCMETEGCFRIDCEEMGFTNVGSAFSLPEPSIAVGDRLREFFWKKIDSVGLSIHLNTKVVGCYDGREGVDLECISSGKTAMIKAARVVNATAFESLLPANFTEAKTGLGFEVVYQVCVALRFKKKVPNPAPISFIVMDGWFPCLMPSISGRRHDADAGDEADVFQNYIVTHGSHTIIGSFSTSAEAHNKLNQLTDDSIESLKDPTIKEMSRFWSTFEDEFEYQDWFGSVIVKLKTRREFRSAVIIQGGNIIHVLPGKISNIFDAAEEALQLIELHSKKEIVTQHGWRWLSDGVFASSREEIAEQPGSTERCTCNL